MLGHENVMAMGCRTGQDSEAATTDALAAFCAVAASYEHALYVLLV